MTIRTKLVLSFWIVSLVPLFLLATINHRILRDSLTEGAQRSLTASCTLAALRIDEFVKSNLDAVRSETQLPVMAKFLSQDVHDQESLLEASNSLNALSRRDRIYIKSFGLLDIHGVNLLDSYSPYIGRDESQQSFFQDTIRSHSPRVNWLKDRQGDEMTDVLCFSSVIRSAYGDAIGMIRVFYSASILQHLLVQSTEVGAKEFYALVVDEDLTCLAHTHRPDLVLTRLGETHIEPGRTLTNAQIKPRTDNTTNTDRAMVLAGSLESAVSPWFAVSAVEDFAISSVATDRAPWYVFFALPRHEFMQPIRRQIAPILMLVVGIVLLATIIGVLLSTFLSRPVVLLTKLAKRLAHGDFDVKFNIPSNDEIGILGSTFNDMTQRLQRLVESLAENVEELRMAQEEISRHRDHLEEIVDIRTRELQQAQKELIVKEKMATLGQLIGTVAHELRNPLGTVRGAVFTIRETLSDQNPIVIRSIDRADRNIVRCDRIIEELLDYTRTRDVQLRTVSVSSWLKEILADIQFKDEILIDVQINPDHTLLFDPEKVRRCVINLSNNAFEAIQQAGIPDGKLVYQSYNNEDGAGVLVVEDNGPGMNAEQLAHATEPLFSTKGFGVGLGLSVVQRVMEEHHGELMIESVPGKGTRISMVFPDQP